MQATELQDIFGAPVLVQFREGVALAKSSGATQQYIPISALGQPAFVAAETGWRPMGNTRRRPTVQKDGDDTLFSLTVNAIILPSPDPARVQVCYEAEDCTVVMYMRPSDILAVSIISEKPHQGVSEKPQGLVKP